MMPRHRLITKGALCAAICLLFIGSNSCLTCLISHSVSNRAAFISAPRAANVQAVLRGGVNIGGYSTDISASGSVAVAACNGSGFYIINAVNPDSPVIAATWFGINLGYYEATSVQVIGSIAYCAYITGSSNFQGSYTYYISALDLTDPQNPATLSTTSWTGDYTAELESALRITYANGYIYCTSQRWNSATQVYEHWLRVVDARLSDRLGVVGSCIAAGLSGVKPGFSMVSGNYLYENSGGRYGGGPLLVYNIQVKTAPTYVGQQLIAGQTSAYGGTLYNTAGIATAPIGNTLFIGDPQHALSAWTIITPPALPLQQQAWQTAIPGTQFQVLGRMPVSPDGSEIAVPDEFYSHAVWILNATNPAQLGLLTSFHDSGYDCYWTAAWAGNFVYSLEGDWTSGYFVRVVEIVNDQSPPSIAVNYPASGSMFSVKGPEFSVTAIDADNHMDYNSVQVQVKGVSYAMTRVDATSEFRLDPNYGAWAQWAQDYANLADGTYIVVFSASDTYSNIGYAQVTISKDATPPSVSIVNIPSGKAVGVVAPFVDADISDIHVDPTSVTVSLTNGQGLVYGTFPMDRVDASARFFMNTSAANWVQYNVKWQNLAQNLQYVVQVTAGDTYGNIGTATVNIVKDTTPPSLTLQTPVDNGAYGLNTAFPWPSVLATDSHLDSAWVGFNGWNYLLVQSGPSQFMVHPSVAGGNYTGWQAAWSGLSSGYYAMDFWANDTAGNTAEKLIHVYKDIDNPLPVIAKPIQGGFYNSTPPDFDITASDLTTWISRLYYSVDGGAHTFDLLSAPVPSPAHVTGTINAGAWGTLNDGLVTMQVYCLDSANNVGVASVQVTRDTVKPQLSLLAPSPYSTAYEAAPRYTLSEVELHPDQVWASADGGLTNYSLSPLDGVLPAPMWASVPYGPVTINFWANDSANNWANVSVALYKNDSAPVITVNAPASGVVFGQAPPSYDVSVTGIATFGSLWVSADGGTTTYTLGTLAGTLPAAMWSSISNGSATLLFQANSTFGRLSLPWAVRVERDIAAPIITIISPAANESVGSSLNYIIEIEEAHLMAFWVSVDGGVTKFPLTEMSGELPPDMWDSAAALQQYVTIQFGAIDTLQNVGVAEVTVKRIDYIGPPANGTHAERGNGVLNPALFFYMAWPVQAYLVVVSVGTFAFLVVRKRRQDRRGGFSG